MAYDPQANRRRPKPAEQDTAPVEALLGDAPAPDATHGDDSTAAAPVQDDPPPTPSVTPDPADPPSDALLINTTLATALGSVFALLVLRHLWRRHRRGSSEVGDVAD